MKEVLFHNTTADAIRDENNCLKVLSACKYFSLKVIDKLRAELMILIQDNVILSMNQQDLCRSIEFVDSCAFMLGLSSDVISYCY